MRRDDWLEFAGALLLAASAAAVELQFGRLGLGLENLSLVALIAIAATAGLAETFASAALAVFILDFYPGFSAESAAILLLPVFAWFARSKFPGAGWLFNAIAVAVSVPVFYAAALWGDRAVLSENALRLVVADAFDVVYGVLAFILARRIFRSGVLQ